LVVAYHVLKRNQPYAELGAEHFEKRHSPETYRSRLVGQLERLGYNVALTPHAA
jgi:transposase